MASSPRPYRGCMSTRVPPALRGGHEHGDGSPETQDSRLETEDSHAGVCAIIPVGTWSVDGVPWCEYGDGMTRFYAALMLLLPALLCWTCVPADADMLVVKASVAGEEVSARVPLYPRSDGDYVALDQFASRLSMELQRAGKRGTLLWQQREARFSAGSRQVTIGVETVYLLRPVDEVDGRLFVSANSVDILLESFYGVDVDATIVGGTDAGLGRAFAASQEREPLEVPAMAPGPAAEPAAPWSEIRTIVIDAGHGGRDTGVVGSGGLKEKDVTLNIASKLARLVEEDLGWKVVLTRGADYYVSLKDRCDIANTSQGGNPGDLLLSIHANAAMNTQISGYQVFYPAKPREFGLDEVVVLEGTGTGIGMRPERSGRISDIRRWDTQYRDYAAESRLLTTSLSTRLALGLRLADRTPRGAVIRLLRGVSMPAAAVEVGFLTNTAEEVSLSSETYQRRVAEALYDALIEYRNRLLAVK